MEIIQNIHVKQNIKIKVMSDTITKYHEMVEDGLIDQNEPVKKPNKLSEEQKQQAYRLLTEYDEEVIKFAFNKIMFG
jgi:ABC-type lipoprotein export system ATPase subunit